MSRRTTQFIGLALALIVGALYAASPLCLMPGCAGPMAASSSARAEASCDETTGHAVRRACAAPEPRSVVATADRPPFSVAGIVQAPLAFEAPTTGAEVLVAALDPPPPDPLADSSRLRL